VKKRNSERKKQSKGKGEIHGDCELPPLSQALMRSHRRERGGDKWCSE